MRASTHIVLSKKHHCPYEYLRSWTNNSSHTPSRPIPLHPLIDNIDGTGMQLAELVNSYGGLNAHVDNAKLTVVDPPKLPPTLIGRSGIALMIVDQCCLLPPPSHDRRNQDAQTDSPGGGNQASPFLTPHPHKG